MHTSSQSAGVLLAESNHGNGPLEDYQLSRNSDGGFTWLAQLLPIPDGLPEGTCLRVSTDGGESWTELTPNIQLIHAKLDFVTEQLGWAVTGNHVVRTEDGGKTWVAVDAVLEGNAAGPGAGVDLAIGPSGPVESSLPGFVHPTT